MTQLSLFSSPVTIRCPLCPYTVPCGHRAICEEPVPHEGSRDTAIRCAVCGARGVISERTDG